MKHCISDVDTFMNITHYLHAKRKFGQRCISLIITGENKELQYGIHAFTCCDGHILVGTKTVLSSDNKQLLMCGLCRKKPALLSLNPLLLLY